MYKKGEITLVKIYALINIGRTLFYISCSNLFDVSQNNGNKNKNKQMEPAWTQMFLSSKGNNKKSKKSTDRLREYICKWCDQQGISLQNLQTAHDA